MTPEGEITYGDLDAASSALAGDICPFLHRAGRVLLCLNPGIDFITAMLAVLKAGATYAPLHRQDSMGRIAAMSALPGADLLITDPEVKQGLGAKSTLPVHTLTDLQSAPVEPPSKESRPNRDPADHAYIIHTAGATGNPKAMGISHMALANFLAAVDAFSPLGSHDRCALWSAPHFDLSVYEIWSALVCGATLLIPEEAGRFSADRFLDWMAVQRISSAYVPPFMLEAMARTSVRFHLKRMLTGGEPAPEPLLCRIKNHIPGLTLINGYGTAEAAVCATLYPVPDTPSRKGWAPMGKPVANVSVELLDPKGHPVPRGEKGEIVIRGIQVSNGYINAPGQNGRVFGTREGSTTFKTGDFGIQLKTGNFLFLGREACHVRFRGERIELEEIEELLIMNPEVGRASVVLKEIPGGSQGLVAYVSASSSSGPDTKAVMAYLKQLLPGQLLPNAVICLEDLPVTSQGKTDRQILIQRQDPELEIRQTEAGESTKRGIGGKEAKIAKIWEAVLGIPISSGNEDFLLLGGHSISAVAIMARVNRMFDLNFPPTLLFKYPEFHRFCSHILPKSEKNAVIKREEPAGKPAKAAAIPLMPDQELIWLFETLYPKTTVYHIPLVFEISGDPDPDKLEEALNHVISANPVLGFVFAMDKENIIQKPAISRIRLTRKDLCKRETTLFFRLDDPDIKAWLDREISRPFNLGKGPLVRAAILNVAPGQHVLCLTVHHLILDGWSASLFVHGLNQAYSRLTAEKPVKPAGTGHQDRESVMARYRSHITYRKEQLFSQWPRAKAFFKNYLTDLPDLAPSSIPPAFDAEIQPISLNKAVFTKLKAMANQHRTTRFAVLLAIFQITLALRTRQKDQVTGIAYAGRDRLASESLAGCLMNTLVVRNQVPFKTSFARFLGQMKKSLDTIYHYRDIPFHTLQEFLKKEGRPSEIIDTLFLMQTIPMTPLVLGNLETGYRPWTSNQANIGLTIEIYEGNDTAYGWLKYKTDRYTKHEITQLAHAFTMVTEQLLDCPDERLETLTSDILKQVSSPDRQSPEKKDILSSEYFPLSPMQHGMLMETLRAPQGAGCYVEQVVFDMEEEIDIPRFTEAWQQIVDRHDTLRLGFTWKGKDHPEQFLAPPHPVRIDFSDWSAFTDPEKRDYLDMFLRADRRHGFSLDQPPAFRVALFKTGQARFTCVWSFHHCIGDGRSMAFILRHLFRLYRNPGIALPHPPSFKQYIAWLYDKNRGQARQFWRQYLSGFSDPMVFPFELDDSDSRESRRQTHAMALTTGHHHLVLPSVASRYLKTLCQKNDLPINAFLMGAWAILLSHYTGRTDVLFGATVSTRHFNPAHKEGTGLYINTLPVRIQIRPDQHLIPFIADIRSQWKKIRHHDHLSLTDIHALSPIRGSQPLSEIYFSYDYGTLNDALAGEKDQISCSGIRLLERTPASIFLTATGTDTLSLSIEYDRRKFNPGTTKKILDHFSFFLKSCTQSPMLRLKDLPVLTERETRLIQDRLNTCQKHLPPTNCFHQLFEIQAGINPGAPAVTDGDTHYSYGKLNKTANQIAGLLISEGASPDKKILLLMDQTPELIAVIIGVLKSGNCYVPMEPSAPEDRIGYILEDCKPDFIITTSSHAHKVKTASARKLLVDRDRARITAQPAANPAREVFPGQLAYIIYTSGSTGRPKGVMVEHACLAAFTKTAAHTYELEPHDRILQFASISFDASVEEIFPTLLAGAVLVIKPRELIQTPQAFFTYCRNMKLSVIDLPTAYWHMIADEIHMLDLPPDLRLVIIGGDAAHPERVRAWQSAVGSHPRLLNTYGPTETTVAVTWEDLSAAPLQTDIVPIGIPFPSVNLCILNHFDQPAPPGVTGELYIGGPQVARGYLNREEETQKNFVSMKTDGSRIRFFKTGDFAKMLPSGQVIFLGRKDRQVKIRGYRVEPGEIEQTLTACSMVRETALVLTLTPNKEIRMTAFVVPRGNQPADEQTLRRWLRSRLPDYMIPALFIMVKSLPHTASGKVDYPLLKQSLEKEDDQTALHAAAPRKKSDQGHSHTAKGPADRFFTGLTDIWEEILDTRDLMPEDNFFDVGGSSLTAIRLVTAIEKRFGISIPVLAVFKFPILKDLAGQLREKDSDTHFSSVSVISAGGDRPPIFFVAGTEEKTEQYKQADLKGHPFYTVTVLAHKTRGRKIVSMDAWEIARRNIREILQADPEGPYIIIGFCRYCLVAYEIASQLNAMGRQVAHLVFIDEFWQKRERPPQSSGPALGISRRIRDWIPHPRKALRSALHRLNKKREEFYAATGKTTPDTLQVSLMESSFWQAYDAYMPMPWAGNLTVLDSKGWQETYGPRLRTYAQGEIRRIPVDAGHDNWFEPGQVQIVMDVLDTLKK